MKKYLIVLMIFSLQICLQGQVLDITLQSQQRALADTSAVPSSPDAPNIDDLDMISETYQIPGYGLYDKYWDTRHIRSRQLNIPFGGNPLRIILVQSNNNPFAAPCTGTLSTAFGPIKNDFHPGVDLALPLGSPVKTCFDGVVRMAQVYGDYGEVVVVRHYNGLETVYANLSKILVTPGQILQAGDVVGASGKTKNNGKEILHFESRFMNECFDPSLFIDFQMMELVENNLVLNESDLALPKKETLTENPKSNVTNIEKAEPKDNGQAEYYVVKAGDTMYRISIKYHVSLSKLLELNHMKESDTIDIGQKIRVK